MPARDDTPTLARDGGALAAGSPWPLQLQRFAYGFQRSVDLLGALPLVARGITTVAGGTLCVKQLEDDFKQLTGARHALAMTNGTATLHSAYFALGVKPGTEVIVPAYSWHASATPILQCGAVPVFAEFDPETLTIDPDDVERRITERTRVIAVTHVWGNPCRMDRIREIADRHGLGVVEDCSHAHGTRYQGRSVGNWGDVGCFSLQAAKTVEGGECGIAVMDDPALFDRMLLLGHNVRVSCEQRAGSFEVGNTSLGMKYRPHLVATVLAHASVKRLSRRNAAAARTWRILCEELRDEPAIRPIATPSDGERGGYYAFVFEYRGEALGGLDTAAFVEAVAAEGVPIQRDQYHGALLHETPLFRSLDRRELGGVCYDPTRPWEENLSTGALPVTEEVTARLFRLPPELRGTPTSYVRRCAAAIRKVIAATVRAEGPRAAGLRAPEGGPLPHVAGKASST